MPAPLAACYHGAMALCPACGTRNPAEATTCQACGDALEAAMQFGVVCPKCDTYNAPGVSVCQSCAEPLAPAGFTGFFAAANVSSPDANRDNPDHEVPAAVAPPSGEPTATDGDSGRAVICSVCKAACPAEGRFCAQCGAPLAGGGTMVLPAVAPALGGGAVGPGGALAPGRAKLILIRGEGFEGAEFRLGADEIPAGRSQGLVLFPSDAFLAPHHATFFYRDGWLHLRDAGSESGTFVRLREPTELGPGDELVVGHRRLRYLGPVPDGDGQPVPGAPRPAGAVALEEILVGGRPGHVWVASGPTVAIGRVGCEVCLPDDGYVSTRHCELAVEADGRAKLTDLESMNGTYVRVPAGGERALSHGDYVLMGRQVLRVEVAKAAVGDG